MHKEKSDYQSYLLRLWRANKTLDSQVGTEPIWRASLQSSLTGRRKHFPTLNDLFGFLQQETDVGAATEVCDD